MTPYYDRAGITLYLGDMRTLVPALDLRDVGCVIADTPYEQTSCTWDKWPKGWPSVLAEALPITASMWCFGSLRMFLDRRDDFTRWTMAQDIVWEKQNGSGFHADRFKRVHEQVVHWYRGEWDAVHKSPVRTMDATARQVRRKKRPPHMGSIDEGVYVSVDGGPRLMRSVVRVRNCHGDGGENETRKPIGIVEPLIAYSLAPGRTMLDVFCGEGAALVVAKQRGYRAIGIDVRENQLEVTARKLDSVLAFGGAA
jgi:site-specific DNA-methyltransferase (adenine-specific)